MARGPSRGGAKPRCRICGSPLIGAEAMKLRRCADCPSDVDVELLDRLRSWRSAEASEQQVPAYVIFTDATLTAIAEHRPPTAPALVRIPGIGARKLDRYGGAVLALIDDADHDLRKFSVNRLCGSGRRPTVARDGPHQPVLCHDPPRKECPMITTTFDRRDPRHPSA